MNDNNPDQKPIIKVSERLRAVLNQLEHLAVFERPSDPAVNDQSTLQGDH